jgi:hypothetical protein
MSYKNNNDIYVYNYLYFSTYVEQFDTRLKQAVR